MKTLTAVAIAAAILGAVLGTALPAAATKKDRDTALEEREASCKAKAARKYSMIHFVARRDYVNRCMGWNIQDNDQ